MRLLLDEMLSADIAEGLRGRGRDVVAGDERDESRGQSDEEQFERAQAEHRALVTYNRDDYLELDRYYRQIGREHAGLIVLNAHRFPQGRKTIGALVASLDAFVSDGPPHPGFVHWLQ